MADVARLSTASSQTARDLSALATQLHGTETVVTEAELSAVLSNESTALIVARDGESIVGMGTCFLLRKVGSASAYIEDVIVSDAYRGQGLGERIMREMIRVATSMGARSVNLTSRPSRVAANKLYQKLGFETRETNVYKLKL